MLILSRWPGPFWLMLRLYIYSKLGAPCASILGWVWGRQAASWWIKDGDRPGPDRSAPLCRPAAGRRLVPRRPSVRIVGPPRDELPLTAETRSVNGRRGRRRHFKVDTAQWQQDAILINWAVDGSARFFNTYVTQRGNWCPSGDLGTSSKPIIKGYM